MYSSKLRNIPDSVFVWIICSVSFDTERDKVLENSLFQKYDLLLYLTTQLQS